MQSRAGCPITKVTTLETAERNRKNELEGLFHPPYSFDLNPCDVWVFGPAKTAWRNRRFVDLNHVVEALTNLFDNVAFDELQHVFQSWIRRLEQVIKNSGEHSTE
jgi:hypothetical protein